MPPNTPRSGFRTDINGLRAWAVVGVVFYHFGIPGFDGGFAGVDVFFVISGYLMTEIIIKGLEQGSFSLTAFYIARARRIVPALLMVCSTLLLLGYFFLVPGDYQTLAQHVMSAITFVSNFTFWKESGYFDAASHEKWLLHTWSLSVEWQFYLLLPIILMLAWRFRSGRMGQIVVLTLAIALSLVLSAITTEKSASTAFFLLPTRAWEMLAGSLLFLLGRSRKLEIDTKRGLEVSGLALIAGTYLFIDANAAWPGCLATLPVAGAGMVLLAQRSSYLTGNFLAQWLGDRSYSLYLWHWPVLVCIAYADRLSHPVTVGAGILLALLLADRSSRWIELPCRHRLGRAPLRTSTFILFSLTILVLMASFAITKQKGIRERMPPEVEAIAAEASNFNPLRKKCHVSQGEKSPGCVFGGRLPRLLVLGDSHASALVSAIASASPSGEGVILWSYSGCPFVPGMKKRSSPRSGYQCEAFIAWAEKELEQLPTDIPVLLIGRYAQAAFGKNEKYRENSLPEVYFSTSKDQKTADFLDEFGQYVTDSACRLARGRQVYMLRPIPEIGINVPQVASRRRATGVNIEISIPLSDYEKRNGWLWLAQDKARERCGIRILDPTPYFCRSGSCFGTRNGFPLYYDDNHLSEYGNKLLVPIFREVFVKPPARPKP